MTLSRSSVFISSGSTETADDATPSPRFLHFFSFLSAFLHSLSPPPSLSFSKTLTNSLQEQFVPLIHTSLLGFGCFLAVRCQIFPLATEIALHCTLQWAWGQSSMSVYLTEVPRCLRTVNATSSLLVCNMPRYYFKTTSRLPKLLANVSTRECVWKRINTWKFDISETTEQRRATAKSAHSAPLSRLTGFAISDQDIQEI